MNKNLFNQIMLGGIILASLTMTACGQKDDSAVRTAGRTTGAGVTQNNVLLNSTCANPSMNWGKIFDPVASSQFESQVKGFVSATLDPQNLGSISGNINDKTGIDFAGTFKFDAQGQLVPGSSSVVIKIFDSFVGQVYEGKTIEPYIIEFASATEGRLDRNTRQMSIKFKDNYGEIVFTGQYNASTVEGTVQFVNTTAVAGLQPARGTLGSFRAYTCALIK
jgi:hypothetical protein